MRARSSTGWVAGRPDTTAGSKPISIIGRPTSDPPRTASLASKSPAPVPDAETLTLFSSQSPLQLNHARYDALNRLTGKTYPDSTTVGYTYDLDGKVTEVTDPTGTYNFTYDNMARLTGTSTAYSFLSGTFTNAYTYDAASNRTGFTAPDSSTNTYSYDTLNRLTALANSWAGSFGFSYDALSRRTQMTRPNSVTTNYSYDNLSHLLSVLHQLSGSTIDGASYTLDSAGNRTAKTDDYASVTSDYSYDSIYELTQVTQGGSTTESYSYDAVGNRTASLGVSSYTDNSSNELTSSSSASYTYDNNGNTTGKTISGGTTDYAWNYENRLSSVTLPSSGGAITFKYDPFGRRIEKISPTATSIFAYDGTGIVETVNASGSPVARYTQGPIIDEPLAELRGTATDYYEADGLGSVTSLTDTTGALAQTYTYDSWGNQTASSGSLTNFFRYTGRKLDTETNLYYNRARYLDPSTGRFLSEDPKKTTAEFNFYRYGLNSPLNFTDPLGWASCADGHCADCPGGRWVSGAVTAEGYANARFGALGGLSFSGVLICTSNPTFNVPFTTVCGFGFVGLSPRPPLTSPPAKPVGVGGGLGGAAFGCTGVRCKEDFNGWEGGKFYQVGPFSYFSENAPGGGGCKGVGAGFELGLGGGGFKCYTFTGPSIGGVK
jgi:RHS repeat-associated protein